jgi:hypothetical protein
MQIILFTKYCWHQGQKVDMPVGQQCMRQWVFSPIATPAAMLRCCHSATAVGTHLCQGALRTVIAMQGMPECHACNPGLSTPAAPLPQQAWLFRTMEILTRGLSLQCKWPH